jgi:hypothetical protein
LLGGNPYPRSIIQTRRKIPLLLSQPCLVLFPRRPHPQLILQKLSISASGLRERDWGQGVGEIGRTGEAGEKRNYYL